MIGEHLLRFNKEQKYIIFDCETCHLNLLSLENKPWQWAWIECTIDRVISKHNYFVKWDNLRVSRDAARVTGFSQEVIDLKGQNPTLVLTELEKYIFDPQYKLIAHNGLKFDIYLHNIHRRLLGLPIDYRYLPRFLDTNALLKAHKMGANPVSGEDLLTFQYKYANTWARGVKTSVAQVCRDYSIPYDAIIAHQADYDCDLLYTIWKKAVWQLEI